MSKLIVFDARPPMDYGAVPNTSATAYGQCKHKCLCQPWKLSVGLIKSTRVKCLLLSGANMSYSAIVSIKDC